jgi:hypothetical protein
MIRVDVTVAAVVHNIVLANTLPLQPALMNKNIIEDQVQQQLVKLI